MNELLGITVEDLVATMRQRRVRIPSEIGAFVALEVCESLIQGPAVVRGADVRIADDGTISVFVPPGSATTDEAARSVVSMLGALLVAAGTGVPRGLVGLIERGPSSGRWDLSSLRDDLEASLVPLNRAAARRVLSRMLREVKRAPAVAPAPASTTPPPKDATLDAQLDALLDGGGGSVRPSPPRSEPPSLGALDAELDATLSELGTDPSPRAGSAAPRRPASPVPMRPPVDDEATVADEAPARPVRSDAPTEPPIGAERSDDSLSLGMREAGLDDFGADDDAKPARASVLGWALAFAAVLFASAAGLALMRPDLIDSLLGRQTPPPDPGPTAEDQARIDAEHRARFGTLTLEVSPERAQVLMFVGRGPAIARELPVGVAHEFVAIADGRRPTRAVLPPDARWESTPEGARYELAMQTGDDPMSEEALDLGPTRLPPNVGAPRAGLGSVRVVTNPPGAKVYVVVGFAPRAVVENVRTDEAVELLVALPGAPVRGVLVGPSDWHAGPDGTKSASVTVALAPPPEPSRPPR